MIKKILFILIFTIACSDKTSDKNVQYNSEIANDMKDLINAYIFLAENHDLLHIMMGEYDGDPEKSFLEFKQKIKPVKNNPYLFQIDFGLENVNVNADNTLEGADSFDSLVDYYQMGYQLMIEGLVKAYKMPFELPKNVEDYKNIKKFFGWK